jgi:hypothetical protein
MDGSSVMWMYHSHTDEVLKCLLRTHGPMEITAKGKARPDGSPDDVDREIFAVFTVADENHTPHWHGNTVIANGMRTDTVSPLPATMVTADMVPDGPACGVPTATSATTSLSACWPATKSCRPNLTEQPPG